MDTLFKLGKGLLGVALLTFCLNLALLAQPRAKQLTVTSQDFKAGATLPAACLCAALGGAGISPQIAWSKGPKKKTKSYALIATDPDAPAGTFYHWGVYNIPAKTSALPQALQAAKPIKETLSDFIQPGWGAACPPAGAPHRYIFTVYALKVKKIKLPAEAYASDLENAIRGKILGQGSLQALYPPAS